MHHLVRTYQGFYSKLVRLKAFFAIVDEVCQAQFLFQTGSIKSSAKFGYWQEVHIERFLFQTGSIKSFCP